jgi:hypothetical protein
MAKINSNTKGKVAEREVAELLRKYGFEARRGVQYSGGKDSPDVVSDLGLHVEVKRVEAFNLYSAVDQAIRDSNSLDYIIFHRKNKRDWQAILDARTFLSIVENVKYLTINSDYLIEEVKRLKNIEGKYNALTR